MRESERATCFTEINQAGWLVPPVAQFAAEKVVRGARENYTACVVALQLMRCTRLTWENAAARRLEGRCERPQKPLALFCAA